MFKAGDRVEALDDWGKWFDKGDVLTVLRDESMFVYVDSVKTPQLKDGGFEPYHFRLVPEDPATAPASDVHELTRALAFLDEVKATLVSKNRKYGNSVFAPSRMFSKVDAAEQIRVRIDDKLTRIRTSGLSLEDEDTLLDLVGYLACLAGTRQPTKPNEPGFPGVEYVK